MKRPWGNLPQWQRERAEKLHSICTTIEAAGKGHKGSAIENAVSSYDGTQLLNGKRPPKSLRISGPTLRRMYDCWLNRGKNPQAFELGYTAPRKSVPRDVIIEWQRRLTSPGSTKTAHAIFNEFRQEWRGGQSIAGLGTWWEWWAANRKDIPLPDQAPDFPFSYGALLRYRPDAVTTALGQEGLAAAEAALARITRDPSELRPCELFTLDDVKADVVVLDDWSGLMKLVEPTIYFMMEVSSRLIAGFVTRGTDAILQCDVDALIAHVLGDLGLGNGYPTHILFERGSVACSVARQNFLEGMFPGQIFIHRTGMHSGKAYPGAYVDKASGKPASKGMIEAFMRKLHLRLSTLPGQTGSNQRVNEPAELDARKRETDTLAAIEAATGVKLETPILRLSQFAVLVDLAVKDYNADRDHECAGFHKQLQREIQPGVWQDVPTVSLEP